MTQQTAEEWILYFGRQQSAKLKELREKTRREELEIKAHYDSLIQNVIDRHCREEK